MHDPASPETVSNEDGTKAKLESKRRNKEEISSSPSHHHSGQSTAENQRMGSQTQQTMNGGNDVLMADSGGNSSGDDRQSASAKVNGEGTGEVNGTAESPSEEKKADGTNGIKPSENKDPTAKAPAAASPPPPVLRGTLSYNIDLRRHLIRGMWNYENSNAFPPQRFELLRNLDPGEDPTELPKDGEFHGSFSLAYFHTTSKGKQKERSKVIPESGVNIKFTKIEGEEGGFKVDGKGLNQFGIFHINGTASLSPHDDGQYQIVLRKRYEPSATASATPSDTDGGKKSKKRKMGSITAGTDIVPEKEEGPLPPPSKSYESNVVCLRGKLYKEESEELGVGEIVHRIHGMWSSGLDLILADPQNIRGLCNRFEYEHKSSVPSNAFPVSGRYSGWFDLNLEDGSKKKITEKDVTLRFRKNNAGYHNVEGKGSNAFGKYSITGTLTMDNVITIFRHFQQKKVKSPRPVTSAPPPINTPGQARRPSLPAVPDPQLKLDEVKAPDSDDPLEALKPPEHSTYSAVSRGVLRLNEDGSHSCQGKWAVTREHFTSGQTSNFTFRLEAHFAADALKKAGTDGRQFPLDSEMFKGSFQLKKGGTRYQTIIDQQIVMKFRKNTAGSYNVYGKGVNGIGVFNLTGTLIMSGKTSGHVEVYRMYPPEMLAAPTPAKTPSASAPSVGKALVTSMPEPEIPPTTSSMGPTSSSMLPGPPRAGIGGRRESTRLVKVPSRLEDDDPDAQLARIMDKCNVVLRFVREKDVERGAFFSEPVDPVALGIPTYHQVINEPMDLRTLHRKMEAEEVTSPEEFARLVRLVFENAMTFNVDPTHSVHQAGRNLLILFNQKYRDIERMVTTLRRGQKGHEKKNDKKRKRGEPKSLKRQRLDEAQEMAAANASALNSIVAAAPSSGTDAAVTRTEFNQMLHMIQQLQQQVVQTYTVLADTLSDEIDDTITTAQDLTSSLAVPSADLLPPVAAAEKKKPVKKKEPPKAVEKPVEEDSRPLTLQEQELLTETINDLPADHLHGVIQIIRDAAGLTGEEDEIDLEIDQLDAVTQRKLLRHVSKFIKKPKQKAKAPKKPRAAPAPAPAPMPKKAEKAAAAEKKTAKSAAGKKDNPDSFFAFGNKEDSDSDSDDGEISSPGPAPAAESNETGGASAPAAATATKDQGFSFGGDDSDDDDNDEDIEDAAPAASWSIAKPSAESEKNEGDDDDEWGAARKEAAAAEARAEDRKKREEKLKAEAEQAKSQRLADAVNRGEEIKAQKKAEEEVEAREREKQEKEAEEQRRAAREAARAQVQAVQQTVDLDAQRDIMQEYEQSFLEKEMGSASPSSDFGF
mmetsp:Transcript_102719/g.153977  ORF Transcript_102719/g.153977 Transcript_102719/m.153977 type:complete len:1323 (+) Transcript_102719:42-4010(+)